MKNTFKQFVELDTHSNQSNYKRAVILLTIYYTIGVCVILFIFNFLVYGLFSNSIKPKDHEIIENSINKSSLNDLNDNNIEEIQENLINILLTSDFMIVFLTIILAYILSKKTLSPLEESYKKQTRFISDAAHELRTPLSVMKAGSEVILRNKRTEQEYEKFIQESLEEVERLTSLSNDLLFLAKNNKTKDRLTSHISLDEICKKQTEIIKSYAEEKNIRINIEAENNINIKGNKDDLTRMIMNLLKNAVDYNKTDGNIFLSLKKVDDKAVLVIKDTGIGIKEEDINHVFERFYKADNSRTINSSSTGLGLSIVKEIVDEHNGLITIESKEGEGTILRVIFHSI